MFISSPDFIGARALRVRGPRVPSVAPRPRTHPESRHPPRVPAWPARTGRGTLLFEAPLGLLEVRDGRTWSAQPLVGLASIEKSEPMPATFVASVDRENVVEDRAGDIVLPEIERDAGEVELLDGWLDPGLLREREPSLVVSACALPLAGEAVPVTPRTVLPPCRPASHGLLRHGNRGARQLERPVEVADTPREPARAVQCPGPSSAWRGVAPAERSLDPSEALTTQPAAPAVAPHPAGESFFQLDVADLGARGEGRADVVELRIDPRERDSPFATRPRPRPRRPRDARPWRAPSAAARRREARARTPGRSRACRTEGRRRRPRADEQVASTNAPSVSKVGTADAFRRGERRPRRGRRRAARIPLAPRLQQVDAPVDTSRRRVLLTCGQVARASREEPEPRVQALPKHLWRQRPDARGRELDRERQPVDAAADLPYVRLGLRSSANPGREALARCTKSSTAASSSSGATGTRALRRCGGPPGS